MYWIARLTLADLGTIACTVPVELTLGPGDRCVCEVDHVHEVGVVRDLTAHEHPPAGDAVSGKILRQAGPDDVEREATSRDVARKALASFRTFIGDSRLPVHPAKAHFSLRRERLVLWYTTEASVDLRQAIGHLQRQFSTKVEVRPIGPREEAAMLGGCGICGRSLCCATWLGQCPPVHAHMARAQEISVIPSAVNGVCGRMKCCLRYEFDQYVEAAAGIPPTGYVVSWGEGEGLVIARDVLARKVTVKSDGRILTLPVADLHPGQSAHATPLPTNDEDDTDDPGEPHHEDPHP